MRIMQLYRIENDYKTHKKRLQSIQQLNSKEKVAKITGQHFYASNEHKKIKINSQIFREREEIQRRTYHNDLMNKTITHHSSKLRQQYQSSLLGINNSQRNNIKTADNQKIQTQNLKLKEKIDKMKSVYKDIRRRSQIGSANHLTEREKSRRNQKEKLMQLLKTQFKIEPIVTFPRNKQITNANQPKSFQQNLSKKEVKSIQEDLSQKKQ